MHEAAAKQQWFHAEVGMVAGIIFLKSLYFLVCWHCFAAAFNDSHTGYAWHTRRIGPFLPGAADADIFHALAS